MKKGQQQKAVEQQEKATKWARTMLRNFPKIGDDPQFLAILVQACRMDDLVRDLKVDIPDDLSMITMTRFPEMMSDTEWVHIFLDKVNRDQNFQFISDTMTQCTVGGVTKVFLLNKGETKREKRVHSIQDKQRAAEFATNVIKEYSDTISQHDEPYIKQTLIQCALIAIIGDDQLDNMLVKINFSDDIAIVVGGFSSMISDKDWAATFLDKTGRHNMLKQIRDTLTQKTEDGVVKVFLMNKVNLVSSTVVKEHVKPYRRRG